jgi:hypothetical protein
VRCWDGWVLVVRAICVAPKDGCCGLKSGLSGWQG